MFSIFILVSVGDGNFEANQACFGTRRSELVSDPSLEALFHVLLFLLVNDGMDGTAWTCARAFVLPQRLPTITWGVVSSDSHVTDVLLLSFSRSGPRLPVASVPLVRYDGVASATYW